MSLKHISKYTQEDLSWARSLPKVELHAHINGSVSLDDLRSLALSKNLPFPATLALPGDPGFDIKDVFTLFSTTIYGVVRDQDALRFVVGKVLDAFQADGCVYLELRTTPKKNEAMDMDEYVMVVVGAIEEWLLGRGGSQEGLMHVRLLLSVDRRHSVEQANQIVDLAVKYAPLHTCIVGVDVCGDPTVGGIRHLVPALQKVKPAALKLVVHFAEVAECPEQDELETILSLNPDRLGHCTFVPSHLMDEIIKREITMEICLSSNVVGGTVSAYERHHLIELWKERGYRNLVLCTDDRGIFLNELSHEYLIAMDILGLTKREMEEWAARCVEQYRK
ncbi:hypothetical protein HDU79_008207 [Rhizoclosmatium sp. JEL0117]|nr:hypothetical protein HDU79_008207 [Rhizoclosmatium sp. JEL0117]